jgi:flagellar hook-basal body complex protein FliE
MTKLIDILRNLLTAPKDVVEFELLAEQKISEIEDMLSTPDKKKLDYSWVKDWQDVKRAVSEWKKLHKVDIIKPIQLSKKATGKELYNLDLYKKIRNPEIWNSIPTIHPNSDYEKYAELGIEVEDPYDWVKDWQDAKQAVSEWWKSTEKLIPDIIKTQNRPLLRKIRNPKIWNSIPTIHPNSDYEKYKKLGIESQDPYDWVKDWQDAKQAVDEWKSKHKVEIITPSQLSEKKIGKELFNSTLYEKIHRRIWDSIPPLPGNSDEIQRKWARVGITYTQNAEYDYIKTPEQAREIIEKIKKEKYPNSEDKITTQDIINYDVNLYTRISNYILPQIEKKFRHQKWYELNVIRSIDWTEFTEEDFKNLVKKFNLGENNYIFALQGKSNKVYSGISRYIAKQGYNNVERRDFWNRIGMKYVPTSEKMVYAYEFRNVKEKDKYGNDILVNRVYVGLTNDADRRKGEHRITRDELQTQLQQDKIDIEKDKQKIDKNKKLNQELKAETTEISNRQKRDITAVGNFLSDHPEITEDQIIQIQKSDFIDEFEAADLEGKTLDEYVQKGWMPLNIAKTGSRGGGYKSARIAYAPSEEEKEQIDHMLYTF